MIQGQSIVVFANDWHSDPTSKHQIIRILSEKNKILWVNSIGLRTPSFSSGDLSRIFKKITEKFKGVERINGNLHVMTPLVVPVYRHRLIRRLNRIILLEQIKANVRRLQMRDIQLWSFIPTMTDITGKLREKKLIYYCVDDWSKFSFVDGGSILQMETDLVKKCDVVITSARELYKQKRKINENTHLVLHGVDYEHFSRALNGECSIPDDIKEIRKPIIGFFGLIHEWIDLALIREVAEVHPDWSIVLIGKVSVDVGELKKLPNVFFLGQKKYRDLPGYCKCFDVATVPFVINELTKSVNPIKLREYLAAGLPVVSVDLPEVRIYEKTVRISKNAEEFVRDIELSLALDTVEEKHKRSQLMAGEDWNSKIAEIEGFLS